MGDPKRHPTLRPRHRTASVVKVPSPTIIVMPAAASTGANLNAAQRFWSIAKVAGPALAAIAALVISLAAYKNQQAANNNQQVNQQAASNLQRAENRAAAIATRQHDAEQVSVDQQIISKPPWNVLTVQNDSTNVVSNVEVIVAVTPPPPSSRAAAVAAISSTTGGKNKILDLYLDTIPACSVGTVNLATQVFSLLSSYDRKHSAFISIFVSKMFFTDRYGSAWAVLSDGALEHIRSYPLNGTGFLDAHYHTVGGCTPS